MKPDLKNVTMRTINPDHYDVDAILDMDRETIRKRKSIAELETMLETLRIEREDQKRAWVRRHRADEQMVDGQDNQKTPIRTKIFGLTMPWGKRQNHQ